MFQGPKGYIAQICEVHLQYGNKMSVLHFFLVNSTLIYILFSLNPSLDAYCIVRREFPQKMCVGWMQSNIQTNKKFYFKLQTFYKNDMCTELLRKEYK